MPISETLPGGDATALAAAIAAGRLTCRDAMEAALAAALADPHGALCRIDAARGLASADALDQERLEAPEAFAARPFAGVPTVAKDLGGPFAGFPVRAGSALFAGETNETADSDLAQRFHSAGLAVFGMTTSPEFGLSLSSEPAIGPLARNPLDPALTPGGSSGGAAAAVAAGIVSIAHATDAGGSIRIPAACCGLIGLKPTRGAIPAGPGFGNHLGGIAGELAVCRSVRDTATIFAHLRGNGRGPFADPLPAPPSPAKLRIGLLLDTGHRYPTTPERLAAVEAAGRALEADGHVLAPVGWSEVEAMVRMSSRSFGDIVSVNLAELITRLGIDPSPAEPLTQAFIARGRSLAATALWDSLNGAVMVASHLWQLFDRFDALLMPMLASAPLAVGSLPTDHGDTELQLERMAAFAPLAPLANISGFPAMTLPFGADVDSLPLPVQIMAPMGADALLLQLAARLEADGRWQHRFAVAGLA